MVKPEYKAATYSMNQEVLDLIAEIGKYYSMQGSGVVRLCVIEKAIALGIKKKTELIKE